MKESVLFRFQLYVADHGSNSTNAVSNLRAICKAHLADQYEIEVVDVFKQPARALAEKVFMTPTLIVVAPDPVRRLVGSLSDTLVVLRAIGIEQLSP